MSEGTIIPPIYRTRRCVVIEHDTDTGYNVGFCARKIPHTEEYSWGIWLLSPARVPPYVRKIDRVYFCICFRAVYDERSDATRNYAFEIHLCIPFRQENLDYLVRYRSLTLNLIEIERSIRTFFEKFISGFRWIFEDSGYDFAFEGEYELGIMVRSVHGDSIVYAYRPRRGGEVHSIMSTFYSYFVNRLPKLLRELEGSIGPIMPIVVRLQYLRYVRTVIVDSSGVVWV